jgi:hypothetical protein
LSAPRGRADLRNVDQGQIAHHQIEALVLDDDGKAMHDLGEGDFAFRVTP